MEAIRAAREALAEARELIERAEMKKKELAAEVARKTLVLEDMKSQDLSDIPPAQRLIIPADVIDVYSDPDATELSWTGTSGLKITLIAGLEHLSKLEHVEFRSGFIRKPSGLEHCAKSMRVLELYENRLKTLEGVEGMTNLEILDISYNRLGKMESLYLKPLTNLKRLYIAENKLNEINPEALSPLIHLEVLDVGGNNLRKIQGLDTLVNLKELWLGKNKITKIEGLENLASLVRMSIQSNRITKMENLNHLTTLEELYLSDQGIQRIEGIDALQRLNTLDLTNNQLTSLEGLPRLPLLTDLWCAANKVSSFEEVERLVPLVGDKIDTLQLERNPLYHSEPDYRKRIKALLPNLTYIDADPC